VVPTKRFGPLWLRGSTKISLTMSDFREMEVAKKTENYDHPCQVEHCEDPAPESGIENHNVDPLPKRTICALHASSLWWMALVFQRVIDAASLFRTVDFESAILGEERSGTMGILGHETCHYSQMSDN
jgi:hypothetical protein